MTCTCTSIIISNCFFFKKKNMSRVTTINEILWNKIEKAILASDLWRLPSTASPLPWCWRENERNQAKSVERSWKVDVNVGRMNNRFFLFSSSNSTKLSLLLVLFVFSSYMLCSCIFVVVVSCRRHTHQSWAIF